jgi:hypothetical protein
MKVAHQLTEIATAHASNHAIELSTQVSWSFDTRGSAARNTQREPLGAVTDHDLSRAAYTQAVALYNSCIQHAAPTTPLRITVR